MENGCISTLSLGKHVLYQSNMESSHSFPELSDVHLILGVWNRCYWGKNVSTGGGQIIILSFLLTGNSKKSKHLMECKGTLAVNTLHVMYRCKSRSLKSFKDSLTLLPEIQQLIQVSYASNPFQDQTIQESVSCNAPTRHVLSLESAVSRWNYTDNKGFINGQVVLY
jgi:hypothetical protein